MAEEYNDYELEFMLHNIRGICDDPENYTPTTPKEIKPPVPEEEKVSGQEVVKAIEEAVHYDRFNKQYRKIRHHYNKHGWITRGELNQLLAVKKSGLPPRTDISLF